MTGLRSRLGTALAAGLVLLLAGCGGGGGGQAAPPDGEIDDDGLHGSALTTPYVVPKAPLVSTQGGKDGSAYSLTEADNDLTLVFFGYTHCPDICGIVMSTIASALNRLDDADRERVDMVFVTTDPARDDVAVLRDYLAGFDPEFTGVTGELDIIVKTARSLAVLIEDGRKLPGGGYEVAHSDPVIGLDDQDRATTVWSSDVSAAELAEDIERLLAG
ncbi:SCO family protein [Nocardioides houyundeii]|uniref:SCO family protein n=1 Tax=Nocardioides houyundeii TaxID=2045452 RepID=UPI000DF489B2|nr:SCO family protein [Nocardioides houyundeii]